MKPSTARNNAEECDKENVAVPNTLSVSKSSAGGRKLRSTRTDVLVPKDKVEGPVRRVTRASERGGVPKSPLAGKEDAVHEPPTEVASVNICTDSSTTAKRQTRSRVKCSAVPPATPLSPLLRSQRKRLCTLSQTSTTRRTLRSTSVATKTTTTEVAMPPEYTEKLTPPYNRTNTKKTDVVKKKTRPNTPPIQQPATECNSPLEQRYTAMSTTATTPSIPAVTCADSVDHTRTFKSKVQLNLVHDTPGKAANISPSLEDVCTSDCVTKNPAISTAQHACMAVPSLPGYSSDSDSGIGSVQSKDDGERRSTTSLEKQLRSVSLQRLSITNTDLQ